MLTIAYVRVSTDDQVEHSPDAQRRRCAEYAQTKGLTPPRFLSDEGRSGKNLDRPAMAQLIELIEADQVADLIVWRIDRLSRDSGDVNRLLKLFEQHCVTVHSINEGNVESVTASGRFTAGLHGLLAQLEREKIIENVKLGMGQAARAGYWLNTPPTGYDLVDRVLVPNDDAHLIRRAYTMRAAGHSYPDIERATGRSTPPSATPSPTGSTSGSPVSVTSGSPDGMNCSSPRPNTTPRNAATSPADDAAPTCSPAESAAAPAANSARSTPTDAAHRSTDAATAATAATSPADPPKGSTAQHDSASNSYAPTTN